MDDFEGCLQNIFAYSFVSDILNFFFYILRKNLLTSTNSGVSLNGEFSKPRFLGEDERMKP